MTTVPVFSEEPLEPADNEAAGQETTPISKAQRDQAALTMKRRGATYQQVADALGMHYNTAIDTIRRARMAEPQVDAAWVRADLSSTLDRAMLELTNIVTDRKANRDLRIRATNSLVNLIDRKAKLHGADAPVRRQIDVTVVTRAALDDELARLERELAASGIDVKSLPSVEEVRELIEAKAVVQPRSSINTNGHTTA